MKCPIKSLIRRIKRLFSSVQEHWVNHIKDETAVWPNSALMYANVHGFDEGPGATYWLGIDIRSFFIRTADYLLKFKSKSLYDEYCNKAILDMQGLLSKMKNDPRLKVTSGEHVTTEYVFRWGDDDKSFNVRFTTDYLAEEK